MKVRFACGHESDVSERAASVVCGCGERQVARVFVRPPRFVGACTGPYAETKAVEPAVVDLTTSGPLRLKEESHG